MRFAGSMKNKKPQLLLSQRNAVFRAIEAFGLNPSDFIWTEQQFAELENPFMFNKPPVSRPAVVLVHQPTGYYFIFGRSNVKFSPAQQSEIGEESFVFDWSMQFPKVQVWLSYLKRENEPDLWESLAQTTLSAVPHTRFTPGEQAAVLAQLDELNGRVAALDAVTREQKELVSKELGRIGDAVTRMDRAEWLRFAFGSTLTVLLSSGIQQSVAASLMRWAVTAFHNIATGTPLPPLLLPP